MSLHSFSRGVKETREENFLERSVIFIFIGETKNLKQNVHQRKGRQKLGWDDVMLHSNLYQF